MPRPPTASSWRPRGGVLGSPSGGSAGVSGLTLPVLAVSRSRSNSPAITARSGGGLGGHAHGRTSNPPSTGSATPRNPGETRTGSGSGGGGLPLLGARSVGGLPPLSPSSRGAAAAGASVFLGTSGAPGDDEDALLDGLLEGMVEAEAGTLCQVRQQHDVCSDGHF